MENDFPNRKPTRLKNFDYSKCGAYFITICTENRKNLLSVIVGEGSSLPQLTSCGKIADKWINELSGKYREFSVDHYVVMPNHIHLLLSIKPSSGRENPSPTVATAIGWLKYQITKDINDLKKSKCERIFQRSFFDHVIRNQYDYMEISKYIKDNPARWYYDKLYSE